MKKYLLTAIVIALAVLVVACGGEKQTTPTTPPPAPATPPTPEVTPPPAPEPEVDMGDDDGVIEPEGAEGDVEILDKASDVLSGDPSEEIGSKVERVTCDWEAKKVTFTVINVGKNTWSLDQKAPFVGDLKNVKIFVNGYEANRGTPQYHPDTREVMFGPNEVFSDNCGGVTELNPGDEVECTLYPVKLNRGTGSNDLQRVNEIWIDSPSVDDYIEFVC